MPSPELENLVKIHKLKVEPPSLVEFEGLVRSGTSWLKDADNASLAIASRFVLAHNAAHAFAHAALRTHGYRSDDRYVVFQALTHTVGIDDVALRVLMKAHTIRNQAEYEGVAIADTQLVKDLIESVRTLEVAVKALPIARSRARG